MKRYLLLSLLGLLAGLIIVAVATFARPYAFHGSLIEQPYAAPDFTLPGGPDGSFHLASQRGRAVLIFYGFTHCPDICPTVLADYQQIKQRLGKDADQVEFVFITVDPDRDTPEVTARYASAFDPDFIGLSGTEQQLDLVWRDYGVYRKITKQSAQNSGAMAAHDATTTSTGSGHGSGVYRVEHSSQTYLVDPDGNLRLTYAYGTPVDDILQDLRHLLK